MDLDYDLPEMGRLEQVSAAQQDVSTTASTASDAGLADSHRRRNPLHKGSSVPVTSVSSLPASMPPTTPSAASNNYETTNQKLGSNDQARPIQSAARYLSVETTHSQGTQSEQSQPLQLGTDTDRESRAAPQTPQLVDWSAPGGALHAHLTSNSSWTIDLESPAVRSTASSSARLPARQKPHFSPTSRADRGPKYAFGSRDEAGDSTAKRAGRKVKVVDTWLGGWQPKEKPKDTQSSRQDTSARRLSFAALMTPSLTWNAPELPVRKQTKAPAQSLAVEQATAVEQPSRQKPLRTKSDPAKLVLPVFKPLAALGASVDDPASPKKAAIARLANLRNLRRIHVSSSAPNPPATSSASGHLARQPSSSLRRTGSQVASASSPLQDATLLAPQSTAPSGPPSPTLEPAGILAPKKPACSRGGQRPVQASRGSRRASGEATSAGLPEESIPNGGKSADGLELCEGCGRTFNTAALEKHSHICAKVFKAQRAAYAAEKAKAAGKGPICDAPQQQIAAPIAAASPPPLQKSVSLSTLATVAAAPKSKRLEVAKAETRVQNMAGGKVPKWKQQSGQLRAAMLAARPDKMGQAAAAFPGAVLQPDDSLVPCPHCGRRFAELTAERHIPKCKETVHKATRLAAGGGKAAYMHNAAAAAKPAPKGPPRKK